MVVMTQLPLVNSTRQRASISQAARRCCDVLKTHVASVYFKCFGYFRGMLQLFQMSVTKVYQNAAYVTLGAYVLKVCSQCFICVFGSIVASVFIWMLHTFHIYATSVLTGYCICLQWFSSCFHVFLQVFQKHVSSVSFVFMLQVLHINILKVDRVLHMLQCA
jgi:hypothetical protein